MNAVVDSVVWEKIDAFYDAALARHVTLGEETVIKKKNRLVSSLDDLGKCPALYAKTRQKDEWLSAGWREYICEDFHFAYEICEDDNGDDYVWIRDAVHSLLYY